jgi:hypothetical protein
LKIENEAINQMAAMFRDAIEKQQKVQKEIQLDYVDVVISH